MTQSYPQQFGDLDGLREVARQFSTNSMASKVANPFHGGGGDVPEYRGSTVVTPTNSRQILATSGKQVNSNIVVEAIPSNYGKITYNGAFLTVE